MSNDAKAGGRSFGNLREARDSDERLNIVGCAEDESTRVGERAQDFADLGTPLVEGVSVCREAVDVRTYGQTFCSIAADCTRRASAAEAPSDRKADHALGLHLGGRGTQLRGEVLPSMAHEIRSLPSVMAAKEAVNCRFRDHAKQRGSGPSKVFCPPQRRGGSIRACRKSGKRHLVTSAIPRRLGAPRIAVPHMLPSSE